MGLIRDSFYHPPLDKYVYIKPAYRWNLYANQHVQESSAHNFNGAVGHVSGITFPTSLPHGEYVLVFHHESLRGEPPVTTVEKFQATFTIGDETTKEEVRGVQVWS